MPSSWSGSLPQTDGLLEVAESVATALDVEHMAMVQEPVEDGVREDCGWSGLDPPAVKYLYAPGRGGQQHAERILRGFTGILQVDAYA